MDAAVDAFFSLTSHELLQHVTPYCAAFIRYIIKPLFHENLCSVRF